MQSWAMSLFEIFYGDFSKVAADSPMDKGYLSYTQCHVYYQRFKSEVSKDKYRSGWPSTSMGHTEKESALTWVVWGWSFRKSFRKRWNLFLPSSCRMILKEQLLMYRIAVKFGAWLMTDETGGNVIDSEEESIFKETCFT